MVTHAASRLDKHVVLPAPVGVGSAIHNNKVIISFELHNKGVMFPAQCVASLRSAVELLGLPNLMGMGSACISASLLLYLSRCFIMVGPQYKFAQQTPHDLD